MKYHGVRGGTGIDRNRQGGGRIGQVSGTGRKKGEVDDFGANPPVLGISYISISLPGHAAAWTAAEKRRFSCLCLLACFLGTEGGGVREV